MTHMNMFCFLDVLSAREMADRSVRFILLETHVKGALRPTWDVHLSHVFGPCLAQGPTTVNKPPNSHQMQSKTDMSSTQHNVYGLSLRLFIYLL